MADRKEQGDKLWVSVSNVPDPKKDQPEPIMMLLKDSRGPLIDLIRENLGEPEIKALDSILNGGGLTLNCLEFAEGDDVQRVFDLIKRYFEDYPSGPIDRFPNEVEMAEKRRRTKEICEVVGSL